MDNNVKELCDEIILLCHGIEDRSQHMTSGNYMHEKNLQNFYAGMIKSNVKKILEAL